jgi:ATP-dependent Lon protease
VPERTRTLPLIPLDDAVVLPNMALAVSISTTEARAAIDDALSGDAPAQVVLVTRTDGRFARVGTVAELDGHPAMLPGGVRGITIRALHRAELGRADAAGQALRIEVVEYPDPDDPSERSQELAQEYRAILEEILEARGNPGVAAFLRSIEAPGALADTAGYSPDLSVERKLELLETLDVEERLVKAIGWAKEALGDIELRRRIHDDVTDGMEKQQREFLLRRQMDAIRKELGDNDGDDIEGYRTRIAETPLSDEARKEAEREVNRLAAAGGNSAESSTIRTYLDTLLALPWGKYSDEVLDVNAARETLDADHAGLEEVKARILEYLAVRKFRRERDIKDERSGAILALVGPPGVGKTSLGESIAKALGREFQRMSLGGMRDEAEIRGHRRTYVGALPGRLVRALRDAGTMNPVILLDEVDKLGSDWRGDPSSALLEVLDPAQNSTFRDNYLDLEVDLSQVLFLATANVAEQIPAALWDRLEVIRLDGYTEDEKVAIAENYLVPRQATRNGLLEGEVSLTTDAVRHAVADYTREAGVRSLERELSKVLRKAATKLASGEVTAPIAIGTDDLEEYLGRPKHFAEAAERTSVAGVATGLAVTGTGGDVLFVEANTMPGKGTLTLTGQLGDVMKESASIALSYVRSKGLLHGVDASGYGESDVHVHVPAGAIPKDGPSAGVTMTVALSSLLTGRPVKHNVGMTGEVTLQGRVLPVGGIKQKVLAAHRAGLTEVIIPGRNAPDLDDVPEKVRNEMTFHPVFTIDEALSFALEPAEVPATTTA